MNDYFTLDGYRISRLSDADAPGLQSFFEQCADYFERVEGRSALPTAAATELNDFPPSCVKDDLFCFGISEPSSELAGVLFALRGFREDGQWYLTLLLIRPELRRRDLGRTVYAAFENWLQSLGAKTVLLAVVEANRDGARFWQSLGFAQRRSFPGVKIGLREHVLFELERSIVDARLS